MADLPSLLEIQQLVDDGHHLTLVIEPTGDPGFSARSIIDRLVPQLPDHSIFDGGCGVTIKKAIAGRDVLANADAIVAAAILFRHKATDLMGRLSEKLGIPLEAFSGMEYLPLVHRNWFGGKIYDGWFGDKGIGRLDPGWKYRFHGFECDFENRRTGQRVEVTLCFQEEFGVLNPYFFWLFVSTTPGLEAVAALFKDENHDAFRALEILERCGRLRRTARWALNADCTYFGLVAVE